MRPQVLFAAAALLSVSILPAGCATGRSVPSASIPTSLPNSPYAIINVHEHIQSPAEAPKFLDAMKASGLAHTVFVGSPKATIVGTGGFTEYDDNNAKILTIARSDPAHFTAFITLNPRDPDKLRKLEGYLRAGAKGVKLYSGHTNFYDLPLTDPDMEPVYAYLERHHIPVLWHVHLGKFGGEFSAVMARHPHLIVIIPHLGLSSIRLERLETLLDRYPTLYTDLSFGYDPFLIAALKRISGNPAKYQNFVHRYHDRVLFGTDMVVTKHKRKTVEWLSSVMQCYRHMLETADYSCGLVDKPLRGLALEEQTLREIYEINPRRMLQSGQAE